MAFRTTRWSLVARAARGDSEAARALDELCRVYWPAVYAMYRGAGCAPEPARDLTQGLFASLLERGDFARPDPARGRFRAWLRACARNWLHNERDRERARRRGGDVALFPLDVTGEEERWRREPVDRLDASALFDRRWAQAVIETAFEALAAEEAAAGRGAVFALVRPTLDGSQPPRPWAELAAELDSTEGALRVAAHRLRRRFRQRLEREVRETLDGAGEDGDELAELLAALQR